MIKKSILMAPLFISLLSYAAEEKPTESDETICSKDNEKRILSLAKKGSGCEVNYKKGEAETKVIGSQKNGIDFCEELIIKIKTKLTDSGFQCN